MFVQFEDFSDVGFDAVGVDGEAEESGEGGYSAFGGDAAVVLVIELFGLFLLRFFALVDSSLTCDAVDQAPQLILILVQAHRRRHRPPTLLHHHGILVWIGIVHIIIPVIAPQILLVLHRIIILVIPAQQSTAHSTQQSTPIHAQCPGT